MMRKKRVSYFCILLSLMLLFVQGGRSAVARTWTSTSGATVDAEFVEELYGYVVLMRADGTKLKIRKNALCKEDNEYIAQKLAPDEERQLTQDELMKEFQGTVARPKPSGLVEPVNTVEIKQVEDSAPDNGKHPFHSHSFAKPDNLLVADFPGLKLTHPQEGAFIGLQYGPSKTDIIYLAFDRVSVEKPPELTAFIYSPGMSIYTNGLAVNGRKSRRYDDRTVEFRDIEVQSNFGEMLVKAVVTFIFGVSRPDVLYVTADVIIEKDSEIATFMIGKEITGQLTLTSGEINPVHLFGEPRMSVAVRWRNIYAGVFLGNWMLIPGKGMDRKIFVYVKDDSGDIEEDEKVGWDESVIFDASHQSEWHCYRPEELQKGGKYKVGATINLGDILGPLEKEIDCTVKP